MTQDTSNAREQYHAAVGKLLDEVMRDPALSADLALNNAAIAAQSAIGKVEQRIDSLRSAKSADETRVFSGELQKAEAELDTAVIELLRKSSNNATPDTARAALELLNAIPKALSQEHDLSHIRASLDIIILKEKEKKSGVRLPPPKR